MNKAMQDSGANHAKIVCIRECEIPGIGAFKVGDILTDEDGDFAAQVVAEGHPNFKVSHREEK